MLAGPFTQSANLASVSTGHVSSSVFKAYERAATQQTSQKQPVVDLNVNFSDTSVHIWPEIPCKIRE